MMANTDLGLCYGIVNLPKGAVDYFGCKLTSSGHTGRRDAWINYLDGTRLLVLKALNKHLK